MQDRGQARLVSAVLAVLDTQVRPLLAMHGGEIDLVEITPAGEVRLAFAGACCGCSLKSVTYVLGIRQKLMPVPGVTEVTVEGVRLSKAAVERAERMYGAYSPWVGSPRPFRAAIEAGACIDGKSRGSDDPMSAQHGNSMPAKQVCRAGQRLG